MNNPLARSLSLRLLLIFIVTGIALLIVLSLLFRAGLGSQWRRSIQPHLVQYVNYVHTDLGEPPTPERAQALADKLPVTIYLFDTSDTFTYSTSGRVPDLSQLAFKPLGRPRADRRRDKEIARKNPNRARLPGETMIATDADQNVTLLRIRTDQSTVYFEFRARSQNWRHGDHLFKALLGLVGILFLSWLAIRHQLKPIRRVQSAVTRMSDGDLAARSNIQGSDDLALLGNSVDNMASRIEQMLDAKRQLLLAISHELRSPLARAKVSAELIDEPRRRELIQEDLREMDQMITEIMESERLQHHAALHKSDVNLNKLVKSVCDQMRAPEIKVSLPGEELIINADDARLRIMLRNLLNNALEHGKPAAGDQKIKVTLQMHAGDVRIIVVDNGPGIDAEHIDVVTDPFYRPDASRTRSTGGFGLGLTLAKLIAEAHGGSLHIAANDSGSGTAVSATIPLIEN